MTSTRARPPARRTATRTPKRPTGPRTGARLTSPLVVVSLVVAVIAAALTIALVVGDDGSSDDTETTASSAAVTVDGTALPQLPDGGRDPAVGAPMPTLSGTGLDGRPMTIGADGRPTMIVFLAHWCPHCRAEVPVVQDWVDDGGLPDGVDLVSVATANDPRRPNHPAADWLDREGWTAPALLDDADDAAAAAAGVSAFPFWVLVDADGNVGARTAGELTPDQLTDIADRMAEEAR
jgi:cytochrome c biogenesis protein CcmG/thiol:disulfide interchange protein DsbE